MSPHQLSAADQAMLTGFQGVPGAPRWHRSWSWWPRLWCGCQAPSTPCVMKQEARREPPRLACDPGPCRGDRGATTTTASGD